MAKLDKRQFLAAVGLFIFPIALPAFCYEGPYRGPFASAARPFNTSEFLEVIEGQLLALRENNISKAYYKYTSSEFQRVTSLAAFTELVNKYALQKNASIRLTSLRFLEESGEYLGLLTSRDGVEVAVRYQLVKGDKGWKISGLIIQLIHKQK